VTRRALLDPAPAIPEMRWRDWLAMFAGAYHVSAESADHVTIIGPTGTGKTTLAMAIGQLRRYTIALGCKPRDPQLARLARDDGYVRADDGELPSPRLNPHVLVWPAYAGLTSKPVQRDVFGRVFNQAFSVGGWHLICEEAPHLVDLGLGPDIRQHLRMGRSMSAGLILCTQRPRGLPLEAMSNAQHLILFGTNDYEDLRRLGGLNGVDPLIVRETVARLGRDYRFLHVNTRTGKLAVSRYDPPTHR
jgi:hypothetical protein